MKKLEHFFLVLLLWYGLNAVYAQTVLFSETFGNSSTLPAGWTSSNTTNGWNGSTASVSSGYTGASGFANAVFNNTGTNGATHTLTYNNNLSTVGYSNISIIWGARATAAFTASVSFQWSSDGTTWNTVAFTNVSNNASWALVNGGTAISLPAAAEGVSNLQLRWKVNTSNSGNYRIDDISVKGNPATTLTASFSASSGSVSENAGTYSIGVTVYSAPASDLVLRVADAGTGTASPTTDFTFTTTDLTFPASGTYPQTQYANVSILNDATPESNKYRNFTLSQLSGPACTLNTTAHQMTIVDDDVLEGVVLNEFSQGAGNAAYLELVVVGVPGTTVDLRGWIIDDNSGIFSGGYGTQLGIADGHIKFSNVCAWEKVPAGSIIVIYVNDQTGSTPAINGKISSLGLADDPTDANLDHVYVVGVNFYNTGQCASAGANSYFSSDCDLPSNTSYDTYTPAAYQNPDMSTVQFRNSGDAVQLRDQSGTYFMGLSYGSKGGGSNCSTCAINANNHPDYATYGSNALYFSGTGNVSYAFQNTNDDDYRRRDNWTKTTSSSPNSLETPGSPNNSANDTWIQSLRANFDIVTDDENWTCALRQYESRYYLDAVDKIIFYIKNNANVDHGDLSAETYYYNTASVGRGFENDFIAPSPVLFLEKTWIATPTNTSANTNYKIRFYVSDQELQNYCDYVNNKLTAYYNLPAGTIAYTPATIIPKLYIYRTGGSVRAWTANNATQVEKVLPAYGSYSCPNGTYTYFEYDGFTAFSGYALGNEILPNGTNNTLPVELTAFSGHCVDDRMTQLSWSTASEMNSAEFILERSADGVHFYTVSTVAAAGYSAQTRTYRVTDSLEPANENYYRLTEVDRDGKRKEYNMVLVRCDELNGLQTYYTAGEGIHVQLNASMEESLQFNLYEVSGKLLYRENMVVPKGYSRLTLSRCKYLADGVYILQVAEGDKLSSVKILVH